MEVRPIDGKMAAIWMGIAENKDNKEIIRIPNVVIREKNKIKKVNPKDKKPAERESLKRAKMRTEIAKLHPDTIKD